jgi:hypothetical protein
MTEHLFDPVEKPCTDCQAVVLFQGLPSDAVCQGCGLSMYITAEGLTGRYPDPYWEPGRMQGRRT